MNERKKKKEKRKKKKEKRKKNKEKRLKERRRVAIREGREGGRKLR